MPIDPRMVKWDDAAVPPSQTSGVINPAMVAWDDGDKPPSNMSLLDQLTSNPLTRGVYGLAEGATNVITGMGASAIGGLRGISSIGEGPEAAAQKIRQTQDALTYAPRTKEGAAAAWLAGAPIEYASMGTGYVGGKIGKAFGNEQAGESIGEALPPIAGTLLLGRGAMAKAKELPTTTDYIKGKIDEIKATKISESRAKSPQYDAARIAKEHDIWIDPADVSPTLAAKLKTGMAGKSNVNKALEVHNLQRVKEIAATEIGQQGKQLSLETIKEARKNFGAAADEISKVGTLIDDGSVSQSIAALSRQEGIGGGKAKKVADSLIADAIGKIKEGRDAKQVLSDIEGLRTEASKLYATKIKKEMGKKEKLLADTNIGIANALESMIEQNLQRIGREDLIPQYRTGRQGMAKTYAIERAFNENTGVVDPIAISRVTAKDSAVTGILKDIGNIAGNFPDVMGAGVSGKTPWQVAVSKTAPHLLRSGPAGTIGAVAGSVLPGIGTLAGGAIGAITGELIGAKYLRDIASKKTQQGLKIPDYRPLREKMGYSGVAKDVTPTITPGPSFVMPPEPLPTLRGAPPLIPGTERAPMQPRAADNTPLPVLPDQLRALSEQYPQSIPIGMVEGGQFRQSTPLPMIPPQASPILSLSDMAPSNRSYQAKNSIDFPLRQEVLQQPEIVSAIGAFRAESERLQQISDNAINPIVRQKAAEDLQKLQSEFADGMKMLGIRNPKEAIGLQPLYEGGGLLRMPIE